MSGELIRWERRGQVVVIRATGRALTQDGCREALQQAVAANPECDVVLDFEGIQYISSVGLMGVIVLQHLVVTQGGRRLVLATLNPSVLEVLHMTRVDSRFTIVPDEETACRLLGAVPAAGGDGAPQA